MGDRREPENRPWAALTEPDRAVSRSRSSDGFEYDIDFSTRKSPVVDVVRQGVVAMLPALTMRRRPPGAHRKVIVVARPSPDRRRGRQRARPRGRCLMDRARRCVDRDRSVAPPWYLPLRRFPSLRTHVGARGEPLGPCPACRLGRSARLRTAHCGRPHRSSPRTEERHPTSLHRSLPTADQVGLSAQPRRSRRSRRS